MREMQAVSGKISPGRESHETQSNHLGSTDGDGSMVE
jgi:hypothetical protein